VELVKNHPTPAGSVEKRMKDEKAKSFPFRHGDMKQKRLEERNFVSPNMWRGEALLLLSGHGLLIFQQGRSSPKI